MVDSAVSFPTVVPLTFRLAGAESIMYMKESFDRGRNTLPAYGMGAVFVTAINVCGTHVANSMVARPFYGWLCYLSSFRNALDKMKTDLICTSGHIYGTTLKTHDAQTGSYSGAALCCDGYECLQLPTAAVTISISGIFSFL